MKILVVNPGSTSTKIGVFEDENIILEKVLRHSTEELEPFKNSKITEQFSFRKGFILEALKEVNISESDLDAIVGMGGLCKPVTSGTYTVNDALAADLRSGTYGDHASNLGGLIAYDIGQAINKPAFIVDPVKVDEFDEISRISGNPLLPRISIFHALNQKAIAKQYAKDIGKKYTDLNLVVAHMGGGISVGIHKNGRVIDANNALDGDGPFTPERSGGVPAGQLAALCFSGKYTHDEVKKMIKGDGGMVAYFGSNDLKELEDKMESDPKVKLHIDALIYQVSKEIASASVAVCGQVDAILITGGICYSKYISGEIERRVSFIAPVKKYPGEDELKALAFGALRVLTGEEDAKTYN
jgi:butyrate kinase